MARRRRWLPWMSLALLAALPLVFSLPGGLIQDDRQVITEAQATSWAGLWSTYWRSGPSAWQLPGSFYRPLGLSLLRLETSLAGPGCARAANISLHILNCLLLFAFLRRLHQHAGKTAGPATSAAWLGAAWFACHPALADTSLFLVGRADLLVVTGGLGAALCLLSRRRGLACLLVLLAALSKETGFFLAPMLVLLAFWLPFPAEARNLRERLRFHLPLWIGLAAGLGGLLLGRWLWLGRFSMPSQWTPLGSMSLLQRLPIVGRILAVDAWVLVAPVAPGTEYSAFLRVGMEGWSLIACAGFGLAAGLLFLLRRRGACAVLAGFCLLGLFPASNLLPIGATFGTRLLYLPCLGLAGLLGWALQAAFRERPSARVGLLLLLLLLAVLTGLRASESRSALAFWGRQQRRFPHDVKPGLNAVEALVAAGQRSLAIGIARDLVAATRDPEATAGLGVLLWDAPRPAERLEGALLVESAVRAAPFNHGRLLPKLRAVYLGLDRRTDALRCVALLLELGQLNALGPTDIALADELGNADLAAQLRAALTH